MTSFDLERSAKRFADALENLFDRLEPSEGSIRRSWWFRALVIIATLVAMYYWLKFGNWLFDDSGLM